MASKRLTVDLGRSWTAVSGRDAFPLLTAVGARPIWSSISKAWMAQRYQGLNVIALAEQRNYWVEVRESAEPMPATAPPLIAPPTTELAETLW